MINLQTGMHYQHLLKANGFPSPTFSIIAGVLPDGLALNASNGEIYGDTRLDVLGRFPIKIRALNNAGYIDKPITFVVTKK